MFSLRGSLSPPRVSVIYRALQFNGPVPRGATQTSSWLTLPCRMAVRHCARSAGVSPKTYAPTNNHTRWSDPNVFMAYASMPHGGKALRSKRRSLSQNICPNQQSYPLERPKRLHDLRFHAAGGTPLHPTAPKSLRAARRRQRSTPYHTTALQRAFSTEPIARTT